MSSQQPQVNPDEIGILTFRALNKPKCPKNWKDCFTTPESRCEKYGTEEHWRCQICLRHFLKKKEAAPTPIQMSRRLIV